MHEVVTAHLDDGQFGVDALAEAVSMSSRQLLRKLRALTGETPVDMIRRLRLTQAGVLLKEGVMSVKEVCYSVGFQSQSSFTRAFRQVYGVSPSAYAEEARKEMLGG